MSRIQPLLQKLASVKRSALIPYITAGDPDPAITLPLMHAMVEAGADIIELGVPFSDPMADGPVIQAACERALKHHVTLRNVLEMVATFRQQDKDTPVILMGYANPFEVMGYQAFAAAARQAGVDGVITVDLPPEEAELMIQSLRAVEIDPIFLLSPTTTAERMDRICSVASGFLYYVSLKGVTGAMNLNPDEVKSKLQTIRQHTQLPIAVGFGVRDAETARLIGSFADAVVVGSALVKLVEQHAAHPKDALEPVSTVLMQMRQALETARQS